jgi:hypothetical protein
MVRRCEDIWTCVYMVMFVKFIYRDKEELWYLDWKEFNGGWYIFILFAYVIYFIYTCFPLLDNTATFDDLKDSIAGIPLYFMSVLLFLHYFLLFIFILFFFLLLNLNRDNASWVIWNSVHWSWCWYVYK